MTLKQQAVLKQVIEAVDGIAAELSKADSELIANRSTLEAFRVQLVKISKEIETDSIPSKKGRRSSMGRVIVDSWPLAHPLGEKIVTAEQAYLGF